MISRLFCAHCKKHYEVDLDNIKFVQQFMHKNLKFANNTYYYKDGCFFKELKRLKVSNIKEG